MQPQRKPERGTRRPSNATMPPRGDRPGFKKGRYRPELGKHLPYWMAASVVRNPMGFPQPCIPLPPEASDNEIADLCREHTARLYAWIDEAKRNGGETGDPRLRYDGTFRSAVRIYQVHPSSPFHRVSHKTRTRAYLPYLRLLETSIGMHRVAKTTTIDVQHWYWVWRKPAAEGGPERIDRAHDAVAMLRTVLRFMAALRKPDCRLLAEELGLVKFERGGARVEEITYAQACAFTRGAIDLEARRVLPPQRGLMMAIGVAAQFELLLRQKDIIGEWIPAHPLPRLAKGASTLRRGDELWAGFFTWENIPGWRWRMKTSKSKYRAAADFDLTNYSLLFPLLDQVPLGERQGAVVKGEGGLPIRYRTYQKTFRRIARAAGIPDTVWSMDARAGGATEAYDAGADLGAIQGALTHDEAKTTGRYIRRRAAPFATVAAARKRGRALGGEES